MPLEDRLGLHDDDGLSPRREQGGGDEEAEPVAKPKAWLAGAPVPTTDPEQVAPAQSWTKISGAGL